MLSKPTILVCTDFNQASDFALKSSETIRKKVGGSLHVLHIADFPVQWDWLAQDSAYLLQTEKINLELLRSLRQQMAEQVRRCEVHGTTDVVLGSTYEGIMQHISTMKPDMVIMGHKGKSQGLFNLGGIVSKVVASSTVPVMVTKKYLGSSVGKVAGLVDSSHLMKPIVTATEEMSFLFSAEPEIVSLWRNVTSQHHQFAPIEKVHSLLDEDSEYRGVILKRMKEEITKSLDEHSKCKVRVEITDEKQVAYHLVKILEEDKVDLAIMKRHQKDFLQKMLIGSETRRMLELFNGNILVLPPMP